MGAVHRGFTRLEHELRGRELPDGEMRSWEVTPAANSSPRCGWRDTTNINVTEQSALANMTEEELIEAIEEQANRLGVKVNTSVSIIRRLSFFGQNQRCDAADTRSLAHYLGHRNLQSTARYTALAPDRFKAFWKD